MWAGNNGEDKFGGVEVVAALSAHSACASHTLIHTHNKSSESLK